MVTSVGEKESNDEGGAQGRTPEVLEKFFLIQIYGYSLCYDSLNYTYLSYTHFCIHFTIFKIKNNLAQQQQQKRQKGKEGDIRK